MCIRDSTHILHESGMTELRGRDIDAQRQIMAIEHIGAGAAQHEQANVVDQAAAFGNVDELIGAQHAIRPSWPAQQLSLIHI